MSDILSASKAAFGRDPFGHAASSWLIWAAAQNQHGATIDLTKFPTSVDLKDPLLWVGHAQAMCEAAMVIVKASPDLSYLPETPRAICAAQYHSVALMLVGYSLETCLKGLLIYTKGVAEYTGEEKQYLHHDLARLSECVPDLNEQDKAILTLLTHFVMWAGKYPDPGTGKDEKVHVVYTLSEKHKITAADLFDLASRVMKFAGSVLSQ